jgi:hypothetical protein
LQLDELITNLMTADELATSRIGIVSADGEPIRINVRSAETVLINARTSNGTGPACELVFADARDESVANLNAAIQRLSHDGLIVAAVHTQYAEAAARTVAESGMDWVALIRPDEINCYLVAAINIHPAELGPLVTDHVVHPPRPACLHLPQNRGDRAKRRFVRRQGRDRLMALATHLRDMHGDAVRRVVAGVETVVGERPSKPNHREARPGMFSLPGIEIAPWPDPARWPRLRNLLDTCDRYAQAVCAELREIVAAKSPSAYLKDEYNKSKFQLSDPGRWGALRLYNRHKPTPDLPPRCRATREMLSEIAGQISGEVTILRLAPMTALPPHHDDYDYEQYVHIGLTVPPGCGIRVGGEARVWEEGRPLVFSPAFLHEVWNHSERPRDVLAIDTWHSDLTEVEIEALCQVRAELDALRAERRKNEGHK